MELVGEKKQKARKSVCAYRVFVPTESQQDEEEKRKGKEEKMRMSLTLLRIPRYALAD